MTDREQRIRILLAAAIADEIRRQEGHSGGEEPGRFWCRTAHPHRRRGAWNPSRLESSWRLDGRLKQHGAVPSEI